MYLKILQSYSLTVLQSPIPSPDRSGILLRSLSEVKDTAKSRFPAPEKNKTATQR